MLHVLHVLPIECCTCAMCVQPACTCAMCVQPVPLRDRNARRSTTSTFALGFFFCRNSRNCRMLLPACSRHATPPPQTSARQHNNTPPEGRSTS